MVGVKMDDFPDELYPELTLETDDIIMNISIKKDYSQIEDLDKRKEEFINDLKAFIKEFEETPETPTKPLFLVRMFSIWSAVRSYFFIM